MQRAVAGLLLAASLLVPAVRGFAEPLGRHIENFSLADYRGRAYGLADFADKQLVVVAFIGVECPLAKLYTPRLIELAAEYEPKGVAFLAIDSNQQDSITELAAHARMHGLKFPLLKDSANVVADHFGAERTPEVFVLDQKRVVRYWGRVDDQYGFQQNGVGFHRPQPARRDLAVALDELLSGKEVSQPAVPAQGCLIGRVRQPRDDAEVTYANQIARLFNKHCVICHRAGQIAPFPLTSYDEAVGWAAMIREVVDARRMPPWHADPRHGRFLNDARLSDEEIDLIHRWVEAGAPAGNPDELPQPPKFAEGWLIPQPDEVLYMSDRPFDVPAEGTIAYQRFTIDPGWKEDRWIKAIESKPGNPAVVHHIVIYLAPPRSARANTARLKTLLLSATAPGVRPHVWEEGLAQLVPRGSKLVFEVHYTPNGSPQQDRSAVGIVFADPKTVRREVAIGTAGDISFAIPPHDPNYEVRSSYTFRDDSLLLSMSPHMHVRGKDFRYEVIYPDGRAETLLWVPNYDFGWQTTYVLAEPKRLPKGTTMRCTAHYDNSENNLSNPDPSATVRWGEQTWEEMMFGWFDYALADQDLTKETRQAVSRLAQFQQRVKEGPLAMDDETSQLAARSLRSADDFQALAGRLQMLLPQLDRVCITGVKDAELVSIRVAELVELRGPLHNEGSSTAAQGQELAGYVDADETVVVPDLSKAGGSVMKRMVRKGVFSSVHVPVKLDGTPCTINFWSGESDAFPPAAVRLAEQVARRMVGGR
jgi:peroxiredoxin